MTCMVRLAALLALFAEANAVVIDHQGNVAGAKIVRREPGMTPDGEAGAADGVAADGVHQHGVAADGVAADGVHHHGVAADGVHQHGVAADGVAAGGVHQHGVAADGVAADDEEAGGGTPPAVQTDPAGFTYDYVEEGVPGACYAHYEFEGLISNDECAKRCYDTFGCTRFSNGGCDLGCRISVENKNAGGQSVSPDGQCITTEPSTTGESDGHGCVLYQLSFFHAVSEPSSCSAHYELHADAKNKAECAHKCKNTEGCKTFSAEPNCMDGCRISKCGHHGGTEACAADGQCTLATSTGCVTYEVFR